MDAEDVARLRKAWASEPRHDAEAASGPARKAELVLKNGGDPSRWEKGAEGERLVARELTRVLSGWTVLHSLPLFRNEEQTKYETDFDVDHLLIGAGGVYCINTKNYARRLRLYDFDRISVGLSGPDIGQQTIKDARLVSSILSNNQPQTISVFPVVVQILDWSPSQRTTEVAVRPGLPRDFSASDQIALLSLEDAARWFLNRQPVLDDTEVEWISLLANLKRTWRWNAPSSAPPQSLTTSASGKDMAVMKALRILLRASPGMSLAQLVAACPNYDELTIERELGLWHAFVERPTGSHNWQMRS